LNDCSGWMFQTRNTFRAHAVVMALIAALSLGFCRVARGDAPPRIVGITLTQGVAALTVSVLATAAIRYQVVAVRPDWVVIDFPNAVYDVPPARLPSPEGTVLRVRGGQFQPTTARIVVELAHPVKYEIATSSEGAAVAITVSPPPAVVVPVRPPAVSQTQQLVASTVQQTMPPPNRVADPSARTSGTPAVAPQTAPSPQGGQYVLGSNDTLQITVWGHPDLTQEVTIPPDGTISLPLIGAVTAGSHSVSELVDTLTRAYAVYIINPRVAVTVKVFRKIKVSVVGQVQYPGVYNLPPSSHLLDAVSAAGGPTENADLSAAQLLLSGAPARTINLKNLMTGAPSDNVTLRDGETLVVREDLVDLVSVSGQVLHPGRYRLKGQMRVLDGILAAGGLTDKASVSQARLVRASGESEPLHLDSILVNQDMSWNVVLQPGDTLLIPEETADKIYVLGDVNHPGVFQLKGDVSVLQAIAMAGGVVSRGPVTARKAAIVRRSNGSPNQVAASARADGVQPLPSGGSLIPVDLQALMRGDVKRDESLQPGDVVVVPQGAGANVEFFSTIMNILYDFFAVVHL